MDIGATGAAVDPASTATGTAGQQHVPCTSAQPTLLQAFLSAMQQQLPRRYTWMHLQTEDNGSGEADLATAKRRLHAKAPDIAVWNGWR